MKDINELEVAETGGPELKPIEITQFIEKLSLNIADLNDRFKKNPNDFALLDEVITFDEKIASLRETSQPEDIAVTLDALRITTTTAKLLLSASLLRRELSLNACDPEKMGKPIALISACIRLLRRKADKNLSLQSFVVTQAKEILKLLQQIPTSSTDLVRLLFELNEALLRFTTEEVAMYIDSAINLFESEPIFLKESRLVELYLGVMITKIKTWTDNFEYNDVNQHCKRMIKLVLTMWPVNDYILKFLSVFSAPLRGLLCNEGPQKAFYTLVGSIRPVGNESLKMFTPKNLYQVIFQISSLETINVKTELSQLMYLFIPFILKLYDEKLLPAGELQNYLNKESNRKRLLDEAESLGQAIIPPLGKLIEEGSSIVVALTRKISDLEQEILQLKSNKNEIIETPEPKNGPNFFVRNQKRKRALEDVIENEQESKRLCKSFADVD